MTFRLIFALGLGLAVLRGFSSAAWAAYVGTPPEVPYDLGIAWTLCAIVLGLLLYAVRYWWPFFSGLLEVIAAIFIIYFSIAPAKQPITYCDSRVLWGLGCFLQSRLIILAGNLHLRAWNG
jgi:hypothetical protein